MHGMLRLLISVALPLLLEQFALMSLLGKQTLGKIPKGLKSEMSDPLLRKKTLDESLTVLRPKVNDLLIGKQTINESPIGLKIGEYFPHVYGEVVNLSNQFNSVHTYDPEKNCFKGNSLYSITSNIARRGHSRDDSVIIHEKSPRLPPRLLGQEMANRANVFNFLKKKKDLRNDLNRKWLVEARASSNDTVIQVAKAPTSTQTTKRRVGRVKFVTLATLVREMEKPMPMEHELDRDRCLPLSGQVKTLKFPLSSVAPVHR
uniref:Uncharacterized protein n=1 Tax=Cannabis sativa TaxID=3483 RepID=A0A803QP69_CANSA